jgi:hypothetical protein
LEHDLRTEGGTHSVAADAHRRGRLEALDEVRSVIIRCGYLHLEDVAAIIAALIAAEEKPRG